MIQFDGALQYFFHLHFFSPCVSRQLCPNLPLHLCVAPPTLSLSASLCSSAPTLHLLLYAAPPHSPSVFLCSSTPTLPLKLCITPPTLPLCQKAWHVWLTSCSCVNLGSNCSLTANEPCLSLLGTLTCLRHLDGIGSLVLLLSSHLPNEPQQTREKLLQGSVQPV